MRLIPAMTNNKRTETYKLGDELKLPFSPEKRCQIRYFTPSPNLYVSSAIIAVQSVFTFPNNSHPVLLKYGAIDQKSEAPGIYQK